MTFAVDLRDLRYFETIAELEHVGRAANILHRTQPALTGCIRRLEDACGAPLFEKSGRGIRLTAAGKVLLRWARSMRTQVEDAEREIRELRGGVSGYIRIGIVPTAAQFLLPQAVRRLEHAFVSVRHGRKSERAGLDALSATAALVRQHQKPFAPPSDPALYGAHGTEGAPASGTKEDGQHDGDGGGDGTHQPENAAPMFPGGGI